MGRNFPEANQEEAKGNGEASYFDRCKKIGRIGPKDVKIEKKGSYGNIHFQSKENLDVEATSGFASVRANVGVFSGRYYYECTLKTSGLMQIGWSTLQTPFNSERGVGDDQTSYAYDGYRIKKWNKESLAYGEAWAVGDIIGTLIDFDRKVIKFWRNNKNLGVAFSNIPVGPNLVYFPACSL